MRLCWLAILLGSCWGTFTILLEVLSLYTQASVSYSVDTNYLSWNTPFPTVTLCEQLDPYRVKNYLNAKKLPATTLAFFRDVFYYNNQQCKQCTNCKNTTCVDNYLDYVKDYRLTCEEMLNKCWWDGKPYNCCEIFSPFATEYGPCFTFNSRLTGNGYVRYVNRTTGLPSLVFTATRLISLRIHGPDDMVSVKVEKIVTTDTMPLISELNATLKVEAITSDLTIRRLDPQRRDCLLEGERPVFAHLWPFQRYSYSACVLYCRAMLEIELCNCTHHFMHKLNGFDICNVSGLGCLYKNRDKLQSNINCECPMACEEINYKAVYVSFNREPSPVPEELVARGSRGVVKLNTLPTLRVRRHAIRDTMALVVDIGGVVGVFFGASLLSVIEIVYLFCIRRSSRPSAVLSKLAQFTCTGRFHNTSGAQIPPAIWLPLGYLVAVGIQEATRWLALLLATTSNGSEYVRYIAPRAKCGSVSCSFPCPGAAPPRVCPEPPPDCATGCACVVDCRRRAIVCFETKNCAERRKLFRRTKKPRS